MNYQESLDYIWGHGNGLVNLEKAVNPTRAPYTLARMEKLLDALGNPQDKLRVVHIAGTKGKGSTAAMIEAVLRAAGHRTGFFSSPHLHDPRERIRMAGEYISEAAFTELANRLRPLLDSFQGTTTFEALTAIMWCWFAESGVDVAVIEVGLGGRLDATNLVTPLVSVITPLGLEHTAVLGDTIEAIAFEKGGIIKAGVPVVTATQPASALAVLRQLAEERNAPFIVAPDQWTITPQHTSLDGQRFDLTPVADSPYSAYLDLPLKLLGRHQQKNATLVLTALEQIRGTVAWDEAALRQGLATVAWEGRVEVLHRAPYLVVDGAHTIESATALRETLTDVFGGQLPRTTLIFGASSDKAPAPILNAFGALAQRVIFTQSKHPRAAPAADLALRAEHKSDVALITTSVEDALALAFRDAAPTDLIVVAGSLFVAAEARTWQIT